MASSEEIGEILGPTKTDATFTVKEYIHLIRYYFLDSSSLSYCAAKFVQYATEGKYAPKISRGMWRNHGFAFFIYECQQAINIWRPEEKDSVIDIGCGDGEVTIEILLPALPCSFSRLCGVDMNEFQIMYAEANNRRHPRQDYEVLDIATNELPPEYVEAFDHVFSFNCLHWVVNQHQAFANMHKMLKPGGDALLLFMAQNPFHDIFRNLSKTEKWSSYMENFHEIFPEYVNTTDPMKYMNDFMDKTPFSGHVCHVLDRSWHFEDLDVFKKSAQTTNPFEVPESLEMEYLDDIAAEAQRINAIPNLKYKIYILWTRK